MSKQEERIKRIENEVVKSMINHPSKADPEGSYTGIPLDENDIPVQDADDF